MQTDLNVRVSDGGDEHYVTLHHLSAVDDLVSISIVNTGVIGGLLATMPNVPLSAAAFDGTHIPSDQTRLNDAMALRGRPHDEVTHAGGHPYIRMWSREYDLREKTGAKHAGVTTWV